MTNSSPILDFLDDWGGLIAIGLTIGLIVLGFRFSVVGTPVAYLIIFGGPVVAVLATVWPHVSMRGGARWLGIAVGICVMLASEAAVLGTVFPPAPDAEVELSVGEHADVALHGASHDLTVVAHALLEGKQSADYEIDLRRENDRVRVEGRLERAFHKGRRFRGMRTGGVVVHETDSHEVTVAGNGPIDVELASLTGSLSSPLHIAISRSRRWLQWAVIAAMVLVGLAAVAQATARRRGHATHLAMGCGIAAAFGALFPWYYNPDAQLHFALGAAFFGLIAGSVGGGLLGRMVGGPAKKREA